MKIKMLLVALLSIGVCFAFTTAKDSSVVTTNTYEFRGVPGEEDIASKYWLVDGTPGHVALYNCEGLEEIICKIQAQPDPSNANHPDFSIANPKDNDDQFVMEYRPLQ